MCLHLMTNRLHHKLLCHLSFLRPLEKGAEGDGKMKQKKNVGLKKKENIHPQSQLKVET